MRLLLHDLTIGYPGCAPLCHIGQAALQAGTLVCLLGRNGEGKSTLLRTMAGLSRPMGGTLHYEGLPPATTSAVAIVLTHMPRLNYTTVRQLAASGRLPYTGLLGRLSPADRDATDRALATVGLTGIADRLVTTLSDGERQKVMIARALAQETPFLLLDEPTAFLDYPTKGTVIELLRRLAHDEGKAVLLSTHDVPLALRHADTVWLIHDGTLDTLDPTSVSADTLFAP